MTQFVQISKLHLENQGRKGWHCSGKSRGLVNSTDMKQIGKIEEG
jgi:hypothetical protein